MKAVHSSFGQFCLTYYHLFQNENNTEKNVFRNFGHVALHNICFLLIFSNSPVNCCLPVDCGHPDSCGAGENEAAGEREGEGDEEDAGDRDEGTNGTEGRSYTRESPESELSGKAGRVQYDLCYTWR